MNPAMPLLPGEPGLLFASRHEVLDGWWGVFRRHLNGKDAVWLYLGEYESTLIGKMTKVQFCAQRESVSCLGRAVGRSVTKSSDLFRFSGHGQNCFFLRNCSIVMFR